MKNEVKKQTQKVRRTLKASWCRLTRSGARHSAQGKPKLVCHCGAHKTGTSLIQKFALSRQAEFKQQGLYFHSRSEISPYLSWGQEIINNGGKLTRYLHDSFAIHGVAACAFSNENVLGRPINPQGNSLYPDHPAIISALAQCLQTFDARMVFFIRPQADFLVSYYLQTINQGGHLTFDEYVNRIDLDKLSWLPLLEALRDAFGDERVRVGDFRSISLGQETFLRQFVENALPGKLDINYEYEKVHNASLSSRGLEIAMRINPLLESGETGKVRRFLQEHYSNKDQPRPLLMPTQLKAELEGKYTKEYEDILKNFRTI